MKLFELLQQEDEALISPLDPDYKDRIYPALIKTDKGYADRETGKVYPRDKLGRQRARIKNGEAVGRRIANDEGIPYGTLKYKVIERFPIAIKVTQIAMATGNEQMVWVTEMGVTSI